MAMNKKEQAAFDEAKREVLIARALNWSEPVMRDLPAPTGVSKDTIGFTINVQTATVLFARSSSIGHAVSFDDFPKRTSSQRALSLYSTRLLALKGLRYELERKYAEALARIDAEIAAERAK